MNVRLKAVREVAMNHPGMMDSFLAVSQIEGQDLVLSRADFENINRKYLAGNVGTLIHEVAQPIAAALDAVLGTNLANCGACGGRELKMNDT